MSSSELSTGLDWTPMAKSITKNIIGIIIEWQFECRTVLLKEDFRLLKKILSLFAIYVEESN